MKTTFLPCLKASFEHVLRAVDVDVQHLVGIADVVLDADHGREVIDEVDLRDQPLEDVLVEHAVADEVKPRVADAVPHLEGEPGLEDEDLVAAREEGVGQMRADEAAATGDQNLHRAFPKSSPLRHPPRRAHSTAERSASPSTWTRSRRSAPSPAPYANRL